MRPFSTVACFLLALTGCAGPRPQPVTAANQVPGHGPVEMHAFPPDGVTDAVARDAVFVSSSSLVCLGLRDGQERWSTAGQFVAPLLVDDSRVFAVEPAGSPRAGFRVVVLDRGDGHREAQSPDMELPPWAPLSSSLGGGATFYRARIDEAGALLVLWRSSTQYAGGAPPTAEILAASRHDAKGGARIDLASNTATPLRDEEASAELDRPAPPPQTRVGSPPLGHHAPDAEAAGGWLTAGTRTYWVAQDTGGGMQIPRTLVAFDSTRGAVVWRHPLTPMIITPPVP